jgi:hypothetical protein
VSVFLSRNLGGIPVDVVINENHTSEVNIPKHPVERGTKISDHVWREPREVEIECIIDGPGIMGAYQSLLDLQEEAEPFDFVTGLLVYENMLVQGLYPIRDKDYGRVLKFNAKLVEVIIVSPSGPAGGGVGGVFGLPAGGIGPFGGILDLGIGLATGGIGGVLGAVGDLALDVTATVLDAATAVVQRGEVQAREFIEGALPAAVLDAFGV